MVNCRLATDADLEAVLQITQESVLLLHAAGNYQWDETYPLASHFLQDLADGTLWVAVCDNEVVGFVALTTDQSIEYANVGWDLSKTCIVPHRLAVSPNARGKGVAKVLLLQAEILSKERGYDEIRVDTCKVNYTMESVFKKLGYLYAGETTLAENPPDMYFVCYNKMLD